VANARVPKIGLKGQKGESGCSFQNYYKFRWLCKNCVGKFQPNPTKSKMNHMTGVLHEIRPIQTGLRYFKEIIDVRRNNPKRGMG